MERTQVVIIGGGATGAGILWDLSLRQIPAVLLEQKDLANGATGRCHGLLHSGGRYAVKDAEAAKECLEENKIIKHIAPHCVEATGGLFVKCHQDDPKFFDQWFDSCKHIGISTKRLSADEALELEPNLPPDIVGAFTCPDAHVDVFQLTLSNIESAVARGAKFKTYCQVNAIDIDHGKVKGVRYRDTLTGEQDYISCDMVINAAGGWAEKVAQMAGVEVPVRCDKGTLLVLNHRLSSRVINRCRKPGDADILVPAGPVCILGTSSITVPGPEGLTVSPEEIQYLLRLGTELVPALAEARVLRSFSGVRPLYAPKSVSGAGGREISRGFALLDHESIENVKGFVSIVGGKLTTYRLMAKAVCDLVSKKLGVHEPCSTHEVLLRPRRDKAAFQTALLLLARPVAEKAERRLGANLVKIVKAIKERPELAEVVCECEQVTRAELEYVLGDETLIPAKTITDVGRRTRLGFGPCQGTFCGYRAMLAGFQMQRWSAAEACAQFEQYLDERWKGQSWINQGKQVEQLYLSRDLFGVSYNFHEEEGR
ncbi:MAG: anaerobic glycerol-3-phosphate dehydrogenase subunit A [Acidobacteria bacterium]|nr:MAG: anaerobic glycerol-3-phosphate dehydrogenase subunit A [Acidobacteriota bacterium]